MLQVVLDGVADGGALGLLFLEGQAYHYDRTNFVCVPLLGCHLLQLSEIDPPSPLVNPGVAITALQLSSVRDRVA